MEQFTNNEIDNAIRMTLSSDHNEVKLGFECLNSIWDTLNDEQKRVVGVFCGIDVFDMFYHHKFERIMRKGGFADHVPKYTSYNDAAEWIKQEHKVLTIKFK